MHVNTCACMHTHVNTCACMNTHVNTCACMHMHVNTCGCMCMHVHVCMCMYMHARADKTHKHTHTHVLGMPRSLKGFMVSATLDPEAMVCLISRPQSTSTRLYLLASCPAWRLFPAPVGPSSTTRGHTGAADRATVHRKPRTAIRNKPHL